MGMRLDRLRTEYNNITTGIEKIESAAQLAKRDLTDDEDGQIETLLARAEAIKPDIEAEGQRYESLSASAAVLAKIPGLARRSVNADTPTAQAVHLTAGDALSLMMRAKEGDASALELLTRAVDTQTTAETPGLPVSIVGPVIKLADPRRPVWASFTGRPMPDKGKKFNRPRVTQRVLVSEQAAELDQPASRNMAVTSDEVTKRTFAGILELSEQDIDWTDPTALQLLVEDFIDSYVESTEAAACTALVALATTDSLWTPTNVGTMITSITTGIGVGYAASKRMPDTLWLSLDEALTLAGTTNANTNMSAMSLIRQALNDAGIPMKFVVGPGLAADTRILGASSLVESYENIKGLVQAPDLAKLGYLMAYRGYAATYGLAAGFVSLEVAP